MLPSEPPLASLQSRAERCAMISVLQNTQFRESNNGKKDQALVFSFSEGKICMKM